MSKNSLQCFVYEKRLKSKKVSAYYCNAWADRFVSKFSLSPSFWYPRHPHFYNILVSIIFTISSSPSFLQYPRHPHFYDILVTLIFTIYCNLNFMISSSPKILLYPFRPYFYDTLISLTVLQSCRPFTLSLSPLIVGYPPPPLILTKTSLTSITPIEKGKS